MASFYTSLSGLQANSKDLAVISNNLANLNTVGYKGTTASFQDLFYQQFGASGNGNPLEVGVGVAVGATPANFTEGNIANTGVATDVAIQGSGFFVGLNQGQQVYFRAGDLSVLSEGTLVSPDGSQVLGYPAVNGVINTNATPGPLTISSSTINAPLATTVTDLTTNLDSQAAVGTTYQTGQTIYDSLGAPHVLTYSFTNVAPDSWTYSISIPNVDVGGVGTGSTVLKAGALTFDGTGQLLTPAANIAGINIPVLTDGANPLTFAWNLFDANKAGLVTQVASPSTTTATLQNGFASGSLLNYSVGPDGTIEGSFSNGQTQALGQVLTASFANQEGLERIGSNDFVATLASGAANIGVAGTGGRGTLEGGSLEQSNVDISTEFANLIVAESGYQANAKVVTTLDTIVQDTINLIQ
jgi:flagellar hook protein FlgE